MAKITRYKCDLCETENLLENEIVTFKLVRMTIAKKTFEKVGGEVCFECSRKATELFKNVEVIYPSSALAEAEE